MSIPVAKRCFLLNFLLYLCLTHGTTSAVAAVLYENSTTSLASASDLAMLDGSHLLDQRSRPFKTKNLAGRLVLVNFIFTHCTTSCPVQTEQLASLMHDLPADVRKKIAIVSVSVDPANDTPAAMTRFAKEQDAEMSNWYFLTGTRENVGQLTKTLGIFAPVPGSPNVGRHTTDIRLFDQQGRFRQRYSGVPVDKKRLSTEMQGLL